MAEVLTEQQKIAVQNRGGSLLVSAAAGSGKTKVLVDRLLSYITDPISPANIDDFLIITFTEAAAAELRSKIASKISERIAEDPNNKHLQHQLRRIYMAQISTVHAFCSKLLKEFAYKLDIPGDFRVATESECIDLQMKAVDTVLNSRYEQAHNDPDFCAFVDSQGLGRNDTQILEIILKVYNSAMCHVDPEYWLKKHCLEAYNTDVSDASETIWGTFLIDDLHDYLDEQISALTNLLPLMNEAGNMEKPSALLLETISQLKNIRNCESWDGVYNHRDVDFGSLRFGTKADKDVANKVKIIRDECKTGLQKKLRRFAENSEQILADIHTLTPAANGLISLAIQFIHEYDKLKHSRRVLDFSDLEHRTLDLLVGKHRTAPTQTAQEIGERFCEVMVDEYQDTNAVQDAIFHALTHIKNNCFMVGDVKQSIYQFRLADPGIFLSKYNEFPMTEDAKPAEGRKVLLSSNFRSCGAVIDAVNDVFSACMCPKVGGLYYGENEALYEGLVHKELNEPETELYCIDVIEDTYSEEAEFVALRISELLDGTHYVRDGENLRPIKPEDIVILLRSPGTNGGHFRYALESAGIRCTMESASDLFQSEEIAVLRAFLQVINNPLMDIPLISVLSSRVFAFNADDLALIRSKNRSCCFYDALKLCGLQKAEKFLCTLDFLRKESAVCDITQLIDLIFSTTAFENIFSSMADGDMRSDNLHTFFQLASDFENAGQYDLPGFIEHLAMLEYKGIASAGGNSGAGAVSIMSIHKSKGLEFPVVFVCALSRAFNTMGLKAPVLCDKTLGLGLGCADIKNRIRYPSIAKRAISTKISRDDLSEEMRILYVAMTRARDRLIMTYASGSLEKDLNTIAAKLPVASRESISSGATCIGDWVLMAALRRTEAGELFRFTGSVSGSAIHKNPWKIRVIAETADVTATLVDDEPARELPQDLFLQLNKSLYFRYPFACATTLPSKITATQMKGRKKDQEAAMYSGASSFSVTTHRKPSFVADAFDGSAVGNAYHKTMQHIFYENTENDDMIRGELTRLVSEGRITAQQMEMIDCQKILNFFDSDLGRQVKVAQEILREFKFSILCDASILESDAKQEKMLLQGVVDCAIVDTDGITIVDFKTDSVSKNNLDEVVQKYVEQVHIYAEALSRIYHLPIKGKWLYFFHINKAISV